ncbi:hypothetical protein HYR69_07105 [Candidatus Sumerlaeota bacterium]|nr:hypothetical protein [Candidatus Sumerlaeota bacterium]
MNKTQKIREKIQKFEKSLAAAEEYVVRDTNVEGKAAYHLDDWNGRSGHPLWMKNLMIPRTKQARARAEKALEKIYRKDKEKAHNRRNRASRIDS